MSKKHTCKKEGHDTKISKILMLTDTEKSSLFSMNKFHMKFISFEKINMSQNTRKGTN